MTPRILKMIAEIDEFKGYWNAMASISPETLSTLRVLATIESIGSSTRIEGARLSDPEVSALLAPSAPCLPASSHPSLIPLCPMTYYPKPVTYHLSPKVGFHRAANTKLETHKCMPVP